MANLSVTFDLFAKDRLSPTFKALGTSSKSLTGFLKGTSQSLGHLNAQAQSITSLRQAHIQYRQSSRDLQEARSKLIALRKEYTASEKPTRGLTDALRRQERRVKSLSQTQSEQLRKIKLATHFLKGQGIEVANLANHENKLTAAIAKQVKTEKLRSNLRGRFSNLTGGQPILSGAVAGVAGQAATGAGQGLVNILRGPLETSIEFEAQLSNVRAATRATDKEFAAVSQQAEKLGSKTSFSALQVAEAQEILGKAGVAIKDIVGTYDKAGNNVSAVTHVLNTAKAGGISLAESSDILTSVAGQFGLGMSKLGAIGDTLAAVSNATKTDFSEMAYVFRDAGPIAKAAGVSLAQMSAHIKVLGDAGINSSVAGTGLKNAYLALGGTTEKHRQILAGLGVEYKNNDGTLRDANEVLLDFSAALRSKTEAEKNAIKTEFAGKESLASFNVLLDATVGKNGELSEEIIKLSKSFEENSKKVKNAAKIMGDIKTDNTKGALTELSSAWEGLAITLGKLLMPTVKALAGFLKGVTTQITSFAKENQTLTQYLLQGAAVMGGVLVVGGSLLTFAGGAIAVFGGLAKVLSIAGVAMKLLSISFWASPIGLITLGVGALVGVVAALAYKFETVRNAVSSVLKPLGRFIGLVDEEEGAQEKLGQLVPKKGLAGGAEAQLAAVSKNNQLIDRKQVQITNTINVKKSDMDPDELSKLLAKQQRHDMNRLAEEQRALMF